jgi:hypothetical protein
MNGPLSVVGIAAIQFLGSALAAFLSGAVLSGGNSGLFDGEASVGDVWAERANPF